MAVRRGPLHLCRAYAVATSCPLAAGTPMDPATPQNLSTPRSITARTMRAAA
jgi:hypothetical protein